MFVAGKLLPAYSNKHWAHTAKYFKTFTAVIIALMLKASAFVLANLFQPSLAFANKTGALQESTWVSSSLLTNVGLKAETNALAYNPAALLLS